jgi:SAM-dependent methyltransferase
MAHSTYIMQDGREASRLERKVDSDAWIARYLARYLSANARVLDVGCGPGHLSKGAAKFAKEVVGVDLHAERFPDAELPQNLRLVQGDANDLPLGDDDFDVTFMRFLLEYVKDKQHTVNEIVRVTKPGGTVLVQDLDGQLVWHYPVSDELTEAIGETVPLLESTGFDPMVGRKLFHFMSVAGLVDIQIQIEPYHVIQGTIGDEQKAQWQLKLDIAKHALSKLKSPSFAERTCDLLMKNLESPDTFTYSNVFTAIGTVPLT